jgi:hypothetical protein
MIELNRKLKREITGYLDSNRDFTFGTQNMLLEVLFSYLMAQ